VSHEPIAPAVHAPICPADASCVNCRAIDGCGYCRLAVGGACGRTVTANVNESIGARCEHELGRMVTLTCDVPTEPAQVPPPPHVVETPMCSSKSCGECKADARCSFCRGANFGVCRATDAVVNDRTTEAFCTGEGGDLVPTGHCEAAVVVPAPPTVSEHPTTDTICVPRSTCLGCFERSECGQCSLAGGSNLCRGKTLTVRGETGPQFCAREGGVWSNSRATDRVEDVCHVADVVNNVNSGVVTEAEVNHDLETDAPLAGFVVVVTVITQAERNQDGSAHFQTFVDVTGDFELNADQKRLVCRGIARSLALHLTINDTEIKCDLNPRTTVKRATTSYVADLTVGQQSAGAFHVAASIALIASALLAAF